MKQDIADKWVKALRSGEYTQGKGALLVKNNDGLSFCCLGVLCELYRQENQNSRWSQRVHGSSFFEDHRTGENVAAVLPSSVMEWAGIRASTGAFTTPVSLFSLSGLNDKGSSFFEIAKIIEENVEAL
jgi:hypothetical protein